DVKKDAAITEIGGITPSDEKTVELGPLVCESKAAKSAFKTLLESANIGSDCTWDQAMRAVINDQRYGALKSLCEQNKAISIFEHDERFKAIERDKDREDLFEDYVEELEKKSPYIEMMKNNFFFRSSTNDANKTTSPLLKSKKVFSWRSVSLSSGSFYDSGSRKKNFMDLSKSPHGHSKKVHPKKSSRDSSRDLSVPVLIRTIRRLTKDKVKMAFEVSSILRNQVAERDSAKKESSILQAELDSRTRRLEAEKNESQLVLEKEKLYSEEMDIKQLQADLAATVRGNDILKYEVQNALDALSYATPKLKYLELQVLKKGEIINQLTNDLQECMKELGFVKAIQPKVF
ncbi:hypothetical protein T459_28848, partial [Capsicum annuum]